MHSVSHWPNWRHWDRPLGELKVYWKKVGLEEVVKGE